MHQNSLAAGTGGAPRTLPPASATRRGRRLKQQGLAVAPVADGLALFTEVSAGGGRARMAPCRSG